jgi:hypothetical protein
MVARYYQNYNENAGLSMINCIPVLFVQMPFLNDLIKKKVKKQTLYWLENRV